MPNRRGIIEEIRLEMVTHLKHYFSLPLCLVFVEDEDLKSNTYQDRSRDVVVRDILSTMKSLVKFFGFYWHTVRSSVLALSRLTYSSY